MNAFNWERFLKRWSQELLDSMGQEREQVPSEVMRSGWLGYPGATEEQIARAEARLEATLPPSYRDFLKVTNGWRQTTPFINKLWSTPDKDYFVYGDTQDCSKLRVEYLQTALEISDKGDAAIYLLNPQVITEDG